MYSGAVGGQKRASDPLEVELPVVVSFQMWVLGTILFCKIRVFFTVEPSVQLLCVGFVDQYHRNKSIDIYNWIFRFGYYSGTITSGVLVNIKQ